MFMVDWMAGNQELSRPAQSSVERWAGHVWRLIIVGVLLEAMLNFDSLAALFSQ